MKTEYIALESVYEHIQQVRVGLGLRRTEKFKPPTGSAAYHLDAAEDALQRTFQQLVAMPEPPPIPHLRHAAEILVDEAWRVANGAYETTDSLKDAVLAYIAAEDAVATWECKQAAEVGR